MNRLLTVLLIVLSTLFSILPLWLLIETWVEGRNSARTEAFRQAEQANETALSILRNQEAANISLEDRCEAFTRRLARATPTTTRFDQFSSPRVYAEARRRAIPAFQAMRREGLRPLAGIWMGMQFDRSVILDPQARPRFSLLHEFGFAGHRQTREFIELLEVLIPGSFVGEDEKLAEIVEKRIPDMFGIRQVLGSFIGESRGRCTAITWKGKPAWVFWQILHPRDITTPVQGLPKKIVSGDDGSRFTRLARRFITLGGFLLILPREESSAIDPARRLRLMEPGLDQQTALGLVDPMSGKLWRGPRLHRLRHHPGFTTEAIRRLLLPAGSPPRIPAPNDTSPGQGTWVVATASFMLNRPMVGIAATRVPAEDGAPLPEYLDSPGKRLSLILILAGLWMAGWWSVRGIMLTSLRRQLGLGFAFAAVLPLALLFALSQRLADERLQEEITQTRNRLRQDISEIESRHLVQRSWYFRLLRAVNADEGLARRLAEKPPDKESLQKTINSLFSRMYDMPLDLSVRYLTMVGPNRFSVQARKDKSDQSDILGTMLEYLTEKALAQITPPSGADQQKEPALDRREMAADMARAGLANSFGPEFYYGIHHVSDDAMIITAGYGTLFIKTGFVPNARQPKGAIIWFIGGKHSDVQAMRRILRNQGRHPHLLAQSRDLLGMDTLPEEGQNYPFLRGLIRRMVITETRISMQLDDGQRRWLIEGRPPILSRQFLYLGVEPLDPILERAAGARRRILLQFLLTLFGLFLLARAAGNDLLAPIRTLTIGMQAIEAGDFSWRSDLRRGDELEQLGEAFNQMARGLEEGRIMGRMVSATARAAMASAADEAVARQGSRRPATVLFLQFIGVSDALPTGDPVEILASLGASTARVGRIVEAGGGDLDKLLGEKILAVFFHDRQPPREATIAAIKAALALTTDAQGAAGRRSSPPTHRMWEAGACSQGGRRQTGVWHSASDPSATRGDAPDDRRVFPLVAGISTGMVISGLLGAGPRRDFTIIGDPVNTAARCTSFASKLPADQSRVVVTDTAWNLAAPVFQGRSLPPVSLKGKTTPVTLYQVTDWDRD